MVLPTFVSLARSLEGMPSDVLPWLSDPKTIWVALSLALSRRGSTPRLKSFCVLRFGVRVFLDGLLTRSLCKALLGFTTE